MLAKNTGLQKSPLQPTMFNIPDKTTKELFHDWDVDEDGRLSPLEVSYSLYLKYM